MEKNIQITLDQARELYKCGFKEIALQAYHKEELELPSVDEIAKYFEAHPNIIGTIMKKLNEQFNLAYLANFFNGDWKKTLSNTGYFLKDDNYLTSKDPLEIAAHNTVVYPGIVYFKEKTDIYKAVRILKNQEYLCETSKFLQSCKVIKIINMCK